MMAAMILLAFAVWFFLPEKVNRKIKKIIKKIIIKQAKHEIKRYKL